MIDGQQKRVLVVGAASRIGSLITRELENDKKVATVIAVDTSPPSSPFERAEFVKLGEDYGQLARVASGAAINVLVDARPIAAISSLSERELVKHRRVSARIVDACRGGDSSISRLISCGSVHRYGWSSRYPRFLSETTPIPAKTQGPVQRALAEIEAEATSAANSTQSQRRDIELALVRIADPVGPVGIGVLQAADRLPLMPTVLGCDPAAQVVHEDDAARAVAFIATSELNGCVIVAADGTLTLSEVLSELSRASAPLLPPWGTGLLATVLGRAGVNLVQELAGQLRYGRGLDNRKLKAAGFGYNLTGREALRTAARVRRTPLLGAGDPDEYEPEVEAFLRYSPSVREAGQNESSDADDPMAALEVDALLGVLPSLEAAALRTLRAHEAAGPARKRVLDEIDLLLRS